MSQYEQLKAKYDQLIKDYLNSNKKILIESFVEYYGEEYRSIIEKKLNEITFVYYINWESIDFAIKECIPNVENPNKYEDYINFVNFKEKKETIFTRLFKSMNKKIPDNLIGSTNPTVFNIPYISDDLVEYFNSDGATYCFYYDESMNVNRVIFFQILSLSEKAIIHEINHAITNEDLAFIYNGKKVRGKVFKSGLYTNSDSQNRDNEKIFEELINEKAAQEITNIFKEKGGDFSSFCFNFPPLFYSYDMNLYLIDEFYDTYKEYIKTARISDNKNALIERIGKANYENYVRLVGSCYNPNQYNDLSIIEEIKKSNLSKIKPIIEEMKQKANNSYEMSQKELEDYYEYLKNQGFRVTVLNDNSIDTNNLSSDTEENVKKR